MLAVMLARERVMTALLARMNTNPGTVSHALGGQLWLVLTRSAYNQLRNASDPAQSTEDVVEGVRRELSNRCHLVLEPDQQSKGPSLKINTERWFLVAKPSESAWVVVTIRPQELDFRKFQGKVTDLPWQLVEPENGTNDCVSPLPLWLLAQAHLVHPKTGVFVPTLRSLEQPADELAEASRLRRMRDELPEAMQDLCSAFRLLQWERQRRTRLSWTVTLAPLGEAITTKGRCSYLVEQGKADAWPQRSLRFALGLEPRACWVDVAPDPDSPSRWLLHGPAALPRELTIFELAEFEYRRQAMIAARLANPPMIRLEDAALASTQISLPTAAGPPPKLHPLPDEAPWEPRQEEALRLALAGHPVCAIKGPPGTGKSTVIVGLIRRAIHAGQRVLLVAPTHVALDEVLGRVHDLRERNLERTILPARVAPAEEQRAQIKPELEEYIARNLGRNLARKSLNHIRTQLAALPPIEHLEEIIRRCGATMAQLRVFAACRDDHAQAQHHLNAARAARQTAKKITEERNAALLEAHSTLETAQQRDSQLAEATRQFAQIEARFFGTRHALTATAQHRGEQQVALDRARSTLEAAQKRIEQAEATFVGARMLVEKRRPQGKISRLIERVFSPHARAVKALENAETELAAARRDCGVVRQSLPRAEANLGAAEWALEQARNAAAEIERELRERLLPAEAAIASALDGDRANWFSTMPDSLRRAVATTSENVRSATQAHAHAEKSFAQAEEAERSANGAHNAAKKAAESEHAKLLAMENELRKLEISVADNLPRQIAEIENEQATTARELERTTRRRQLLQRWLEFYEHEDGDEQLTAWALNSVNLVAATTQGIAGSKEFSEHNFDLVICDESSRVTRGEILVPADRAARIVLVGDEKQLPPYVEADDEQLIQALATIQLSGSRPEALPEMAQRLCDAWNVDEPEFRPVRVEEVCERARTLMVGGDMPAWPASTTETSVVDERLRAWRNVADALTGSCFDHLLGLLPAKRVVRLSVQRRMVAEIATLVSEPVYGGDYQSPKASPVAPLLTEAFRHAWVFFNTRSYCAARSEFRENHQGTGFINEGEARTVVLALKQHVASARRTGKPVSLMVITFYLAQARLIESLVRKDKELRRDRIAILPIDRCQGQEADAVVVSFVRTLPRPRPNAGRWLQDVRRLNVACTRARHSLVLVGNLQTLTALRGDAEGEKLLAHLGRCVVEHPDHQIEQLHGL